MVTELKELIVKHVAENTEFVGSFGNTYNICEIVNNLTNNTLANMISQRMKNIDVVKIKIDCAITHEDNEKINKLQEEIDLFKLVAQYKKERSDKERNEKLKEQLKEELKNLKESQKTPQERITELEAKIASM